jgi:hypothetical protein
LWDLGGSWMCLIHLLMSAPLEGNRFWQEAKTLVSYGSLNLFFCELYKLVNTSVVSAWSWARNSYIETPSKNRPNQLDFRCVPHHKRTSSNVWKTYGPMVAPSPTIRFSKQRMRSSNVFSFSDVSESEDVDGVIGIKWLVHLVGEPWSVVGLIALSTWSLATAVCRFMIIWNSSWIAIKHWSSLS